ncbi:MAG: class I SAM-dependent methyltransferase [Rhodomicrobium sp.]
MIRPQSTLLEALADVLEPAGKMIVDVGCGDGAIVRHLARLGATAIGVEVSEGQLERARANAEAGGTYRVASGENLPFADASADAILYMKSFHHLPLAAMPLALSEAARVLAPQGRLIVIEPLAEENYFEAMRPMEDETEVRAAAYTALQNPPPPLLPDGELVYDTAVRPRDANHFIEVIIAADPARRERLPRVESELRRRYEALAHRDADGVYFIAPMRRNVFRRSG